MDPNETLKRLRELLGGEDEVTMSPRQIAKALCDTSELFQALDEWLSKGGALPETWKIESNPEILLGPAIRGILECDRCGISL